MFCPILQLEDGVYILLVILAKKQNQRGSRFTVSPTACEEQYVNW